MATSRALVLQLMTARRIRQDISKAIGIPARKLLWSEEPGEAGIVVMFTTKSVIIVYLSRSEWK